jgi:hypothetical protein
MAARNSFYAQPAALKSSVFFYGLNGIFAAGRRVTAGIRQQRPDAVLVKLYKCYGYGFQAI